MHFQQLLLLTASSLLATEGCGPGRGPMRRRGPRKILPLIYKQHDPNFSEQSLAASGLPDGSISREDKQFRTNLVPNYNPDIIFKDEEGTGADRLMTQRCKEKLNTLAISVMNQWPGVRVRVTEAWDEESHHARNSLHYEGRAVDITTSDRDRAKYGLLAALAVEAGFDWVYYESRSHVHASCRAESAHPGQNAGCFPAAATVRTTSGPKTMAELVPGDRVQAVANDGSIVFSEVLMFLDRSPMEVRRFVTLKTEGGRTLTLTETHLVFSGPRWCEEVGCMEATYAGLVQVGQAVMVEEEGELVAHLVEAVGQATEVGVFAPLTSEGNLLVDGVLASSYAVIDSQGLAHASFAPLRWASNLAEGSSTLWRALSLAGPAPRGGAPTEGVHWYPRLLYSVAEHLLPSHLLP